MTALRLHDRLRDQKPDEIRVRIAAYDFAAVARRNEAVSLVPARGEESAYLAEPIDLAPAVAPDSPIRPIGDGDVAAPLAVAAPGDQAAPSSERGPSMSLRKLPSRIWRALRRLQPMFPPMSCC